MVEEAGGIRACVPPAASGALAMGVEWRGEHVELAAGMMLS